MFLTATGVPDTSHCGLKGTVSEISPLFEFPSHTRVDLCGEGGICLGAIQGWSVIKYSYQGDSHRHSHRQGSSDCLYPQKIQGYCPEQFVESYQKVCCRNFCFLIFGCGWG